MSTEVLESEPRLVRAHLLGSPGGIPLDVTHDVRIYVSESAKSHRLESMFLRMKYAADRVIGWTMLIFACPIIALLWCAVKATSPGPGFYTQRRLGLGGREFQIVKLRTMRFDAEANGVAWSQKSDRRVTWLGRLLRALHLDELPQLWNVANGDMSLVGPRPERPEITQSLEKLIPNYHARHSVKPGITGLSQINLEPDRNINVTRQKQILDLRYIELANPWFDARMIGVTLLRMAGIRGNRVVKLARLQQLISEHELMAIGYEFGVPESELWNPSKGPV